jgi:hypothetical protein
MTTKTVDAVLSAALAAVESYPAYEQMAGAEISWAVAHELFASAGRAPSSEHLTALAVVTATLAA